MNIEIPFFDINMIRSKRCLILGEPEMGKTTLIRDLVYYLNRKDNVFINDNNDEIIKNYIKRQKRRHRIGYKNRNSCIIFDDCVIPNDIWYENVYNKILFKNIKSLSCDYILSTKHILDISSYMIMFSDVIFILKINIQENKRRIWNFIGKKVFRTFEIFEHILDICTEDYECLVISKDINNRYIFFWYKADII